jgi:hypothetical protein
LSFSRHQKAEVMIRSLLLLALATLIGGSGCGSGETGPKLETVVGKVTYQGEPVKEGDISLIPIGPTGKSAGGKIIDGTFTLQVDAGKKKVEIVALRDVPGKFNEDNPGEKVQVREQFIPAEYNSKTKLEYEVTVGGQNDPVFDLKKS